MPGTDTLAVEVTHISSNGVWILIGEGEFVLPYADFPWFRQATVDQILAVELPAMTTREGPAKESGARASDVQVTSGAGGETGAHGARRSVHGRGDWGASRR